MISSIRHVKLSPTKHIMYRVEGSPFRDATDNIWDTCRSSNMHPYVTKYPTYRKLIQETLNTSQIRRQGPRKAPDLGAVDIVADDAPNDDVVVLEEAIPELSSKDTRIL